MATAQRHHGASFLIDDVNPGDVLTPEDMGEEERMMMKAMQDFAKKELEPVYDKVEQRDEKVIRDLFRKAADLGIFMAEVPEEYGGLGLSVLAIAGMNESRSYLGPLSSTVFAHQGIGSLPIINFGTPEQVEKYLRPCMEGRLMAAFALTEPSSGSDAMNIKTTAVLSDDGTQYILNGSKQFITNAGWADIFILFAKVDGQQFTAFLVESKTPGISVGENEKLLGLAGSSVCPITLEDVKIPAENVLGEIGKGHKVALCTLNLGRLKMSANCAGYCKKILACAAQYAAERHQSGNPIAEFGMIQKKLAEMAARCYAAESVAYRTAGLVYAGIEAMGEKASQSIDVKLKVLTEFSIECAMAKVFGSEAFNALADDALQIHGGYGFSEEYPPAKFYRDSRITRIYEGTSEICRLTSMKAILKRAAAKELRMGEAIAALEPNKDSRLDDAAADLATVRSRICEFKKIFLYLMGQILDRFGQEAIISNENQGYLESLASIAIETYASESAVLRVMKINESQPGADTELPEALARLYAERAAGRVREEATEVLSALHEGAALREHLAAVEGWLPLPAGRIELRASVSRAVVERGGVLPEYTN